MNLEHALADPTSEFSSPEAVLEHEELTVEQKKAILERWRQDAELLLRAEAENMAGGEPNMLHRVQQALDRL
ncbi:MAG: hypothetical protein P8172_11315 [Gammaproteobacteria bacterium]|jgi:hypothetical protein